MANLKETSTWEAGIYQLETSDPVMGGENGIDNRAPRQLANRTLWLKNELARQIGLVNQTNNNLGNQKADKSVQLTAGGGLTGGGDLSAHRTLSLGTPSKITATSTNVAVSNTHSHEIDKATTTTQGIVKLNNSLTSTSQTEALTANMGKTLQDKKLDKTGGMVTGEIVSTSPNAYRLKHAGKGRSVLLRFDGDALYLLKTADGNPDGSWDSTRPFVWNVVNNTVTINGNSATASKLQNARNIAITGDGSWNVNFDGTQNATGTFTLAGSGVTAGSYNGVTVDAKGRVTAGLTQTHGLVTATTATGVANTATNNSNTFLNIVASGVGQTASVGSSTQITGANGISVSSDTVGKLIISQTLANTLTDTSTTKSLTANMGKVLKDELTALDNAKLNHHGTLGTTDLNTLIATDHVGLWHQTGNAGATTTKNYPIAKAGTLWVLPSAYLGVQFYVPFDEQVLYIRHSRNGTPPATWSAWRVIGQTINNLNSTSTTASLSANQGKILNDTKVSLSGNETIAGVKTFASAPVINNPTVWSAFQKHVADGTWVMEFPPAGSNDLRFNVKFSPNDTSKSAIYIRAPKVSKDETLAYQSWVQDANVASATKLHTARTINGVAFDGTKNITITDSTKLGKTENAVSATKLQTARQIALTGAVTGRVNFDGSGNVSLATTLKAVQRTTKTMTLTPAHNSFKTQKVSVTGMIEVYPDGRIVQYFSFVAPIVYFLRTGLQAFYRSMLNLPNFSSSDGVLLELPLWTPMPNKVQEARIHLSSNTTTWAFGEALEWAYDWDSIFNQHASIKDKAYFAFRRVAGNNDEPVSFTIIVEGY